MALFTEPQLLERLGARLDALTAGRDADPRQRTLRATIEWSYALLDEAERRLFARLAVFAGGSTYEAAETVCGADAETLESLLDKSLVRRTDGEQPRYWMLATIHEFASQLLAKAPDVEPVRRRHAEHLLTLAERAEPELFEGDQRRWARTLATEHDNIRAALAWADAADPKLRLRLAVAMGRFWALRGYLSEGQSWLARALGDDVDPALRSRALAAAGLLARIEGDWERVRQLDEEALRLARLSGDARTTALSLNGLTAAAGFTGDWELALRYGLEARDIALSIGDLRTAGGSHFNLGDVALHLGRFEDAIDHGQQALTLLHEVGNRELLALSLSVIGLSALEKNDEEQAARSFREGLLLAGELQFAEAIAASVEGLAALADPPDHAARLLGVADGVRGAVPARPAFERRRQRTEAGLRERLGDDRFAALVREGRELPLEDALGYAAGA